MFGVSLFNKKLIAPILEEYMKKFPQTALDDVKLTLEESGVDIEVEGNLPSLRVVNVLINVVLKHVVPAESAKYFIYDIALAIEEAIMHVFHHDCSENLDRVKIQLRFSEELIHIEISDIGSQAKEIDFESILNHTPEDKFSESGRGILLIKKAIDVIEYHHKNGQNTLVLVKYFPGKDTNER